MSYLAKKRRSFTLRCFIGCQKFVLLSLIFSLLVLLTGLGLNLYYDELDEEGRESLLAMAAQAKSVEAREFIEDEFDNVPWKFRLDLLFESTTNNDTPPWITGLWVTERLSGTNAIAGLQAEGRVFYANQEFTDSFFNLTSSRFDPGPEPEPVNLPPDNPPAIETTPPETNP